jgi:hypothetical protein
MVDKFFVVSLMYFTKISDLLQLRMVQITNVSTHGIFHSENRKIRFLGKIFVANATTCLVDKEIYFCNENNNDLPVSAPPPKKKSGTSMKLTLRRDYA